MSGRGRGKIEDLAITILLQAPGPVNADLVGERERLALSTGPSRRVNPPEGKTCLSTSFGTPLRRRRDANCRGFQLLYGKPMLPGRWERGTRKPSRI